MKLIAKALILSTALVSINYATNEDLDIQLDCLIKNVYFEAQGEPYQGKLAVALVTLNRAESTICEAVTAKGQFSWTKFYSTKPRDQVMWDESVQAAYDAYYGEYTFPATHYHNNKVKPKWAKKLKKLTKIGNHIFYEKL